MCAKSLRRFEGTAPANVPSSISYCMPRISKILQAKQMLFAVPCLNETPELAEVTSLFPVHIKLFSNPTLSENSTEAYPLSLS